MFTAKKKPDLTQIWQDYTVGKMTYKSLAEKYQCSVRTIQRYLQKVPKMALKSPENKQLNLIVDTTFFRRDFDLLVFMDSVTKKVVYHRVVSTEKDIYYLLGINKLIEKGYKIQSITCDGRRGLFRNIGQIPVQMCHFHQVAIVMRNLTKSPKSEAGKALKSLILTLKNQTKNDFFRELHLWYLAHQEFIDERSTKPNEKGKFPFKHRGIRSARASLKRNADELFTFEKYADFGIEKTTSRLEGLFSEMKRLLANHHGLSKRNKIMFIKDFLNKKAANLGQLATFLSTLRG